METALAESTALSSKSEREYITLRDSIKSMTESWKTDTDRLREEIKRREEKWKVEEQSMGKKYRLLVEEVQAAETARLQSVDLREENTRIGKELEEAWAEEISAMRSAMEKSNKDSEEANATAKCVVSTFLLRLVLMLLCPPENWPPSLPVCAVSCGPLVEQNQKRHLHDPCPTSLSPLLPLDVFCAPLIYPGFLIPANCFLHLYGPPATYSVRETLSFSFLAAIAPA